MSGVTDTILLQPNDNNEHSKKIKMVPQGSHKGKGMAVFTSGGDSQGKNFW